MGWDFEKAHSLFTPCVFANSSGKKKNLSVIISINGTPVFSISIN